MANDSLVFKPANVSERDWSVASVVAARVPVGVAVKIDSGYIRGWGVVTKKDASQIVVKMDDGKNETTAHFRMPVLVSLQDFEAIEQAEYEAAAAARIRDMKEAFVSAAVEVEERKAAQEKEAAQVEEE